MQKALTHPETTTLVKSTPNYIHLATSENTRKAYRSDIAHFENWGGKLPANAQMIVQYLEAHAPQLNSRTLSRRLVALKHWHTYQGFPDPTTQPIVKKTLVGIARTHGKPKQKALPITLAQIEMLHQHLNQEPSLTAIRDNALILIGFFGGLRRSELVSLHVEHCRFEERGLEILLPHSKTDQTHEGQFVVIPYGSEKLCPIKTLKRWLTESQIQQGAIFRRITQHEKMGLNALTPLAVNHILKKRTHEIGLTETTLISSHSLRRGLATAAARAGAPIHTIMRAGRWKQTNTVMEYIEATERFTDNAAALLLTNTTHRK